MFVLTQTAAPENQSQAMRPRIKDDSRLLLPLARALAVVLGMRVPDSVVTHGARELTDSKEERGREALDTVLLVRRRVRSSMFACSAQH